MLGHLAKDIAPVGLQIGESRLHDVGLLGALEILSPAADPLLGFQQQAGELRPDLLGQEFHQGDAEQQVQLDLLLVFGAGDGGLHQFERLALPGSGFRTLGGLGSRLDREGQLRGLPNEFQQVDAGLFAPGRAQVHVVMDVIDTDGERAERKLRRVGFQVDAGKTARERRFKGPLGRHIS